MNTGLLMDQIVRQTTVLLAQIATTAGLRAPLAHVANQIFLDLVNELERQGVGQKVIADMFGLALRSYQQKVQRLKESETERGSTLWEAVHSFLQERKVVSRADVLLRFARDDGATVRSILNDLVASGLVYRTGSGDASVYRVTPDDDLERLRATDSLDELSSLVWVEIYRNGPLSRTQLLERLSVDGARLDECLARLTDEGRVADDAAAYRSEECLIPLGDQAGWAAALLDHYQAVVGAMISKLDNGATRALPDDELGGSTFAFDVWPGHPHEDQVRGLLSDTRQRVAKLWDDVQAHNQSAGEAAREAEAERVTFYCGQAPRPVPRKDD